MRALLRFQAVVAVRAMCNRGLLAIVGLPILAAVLILLVAKGDWDWASCATLAFAIVLPTVALGMGMTFDAMDAIRWSAPVPRSRVLGAHIVFWTAVSAPLIACAAATRAGETPGGAVAFADAMIVTLAAAATVPVAQNWRRNPTFESAMRLIGLVLTVALLATWSIDLARADRSAYCLAPSIAALCIAGTVCMRCYFREERLPATTGTTDPRDIAPARRAARTPAASVSAGVPNGGVLAVLAVVVIAIQFFPSAPDGLMAIQLLSVTSMIATGSLASCRWLLAGPMERGRMFRRRFLPVVLFAVVGVTVHSIVQEFRPDRTVLFDAFRPNREFVHHRDALTLPQLLDVDGPQIPVMAEGVREYLGHTYGLDVTKGRVEALIRSGCLHSGWKEGDKSPLSEEAVFAAMDRVHDDLVGEIVAADRRRIAVNACVGVLLCIVLLRGQLVGFTSRWAFSGLLFAGCAVIFAPVFAPRSSVAMAVVAAERAVLSFVERISLPVALLVFVALALLLWKSCERAFRRLDLTDLPPMTNAWGKAQ